MGAMEGPITFDRDEERSVGASPGLPRHPGTGGGRFGTPAHNRAGSGEPETSVSDVIVDAERAATGLPSRAEMNRGRFNLSRQMVIRIAHRRHPGCRGRLHQPLVSRLGIVRGLGGPVPPDSPVSFVHRRVRPLRRHLGGSSPSFDRSPTRHRSPESSYLRVLHFERWLFDGQIPTISLQSDFFKPRIIALVGYST